MLEVYNRLEEFTKIHDEFIRGWSDAVKSGDTSMVERMADDYYVAFFNGESEKPVFFTKQEAVDGMGQSVTHFLGAEKTFENRVIRLRNTENAVVFFEQLIVKDGEILARVFTIENWGLINGRWMVTREIEEAVN